MDKREVAEDLYKAGQYEIIILTAWVKDDKGLSHYHCSRFLNLANKYGVEVTHNLFPDLWNNLYELKDILIDLLSEE